MQIINIWNKFNLSGKKIAFAFLFIVLSQLTYGQARVQHINLPRSDKKILKYGFAIGIFNADYRIEYDDRFELPELGNITQINPKGSSSFSIGPIVNLKLLQFIDLQSKLRFSFYQNTLEFNFTDADPKNFTVEATRVEFPLLFKYKSKRRRNSRVYVIGGFNPSIRTSAKKNERELDNIILIDRFNASVEFGFGFDFYFPLFRFSPEFRFAKGLTNILDRNGNNEVNQALRGLYVNSFSIYLQVGD